MATHNRNNIIPVVFKKKVDWIKIVSIINLILILGLYVLIILR